MLIQVGSGLSSGSCGLSRAGRGLRTASCGLGTRSYGLNTNSCGLSTVSCGTRVLSVCPGCWGGAIWSTTKPLPGTATCKYKSAQTPCVCRERKQDKAHGIGCHMGAFVRTSNLRMCVCMCMCKVCCVCLCVHERVGCICTCMLAYMDSSLDYLVGDLEADSQDCPDEQALGRRDQIPQQHSSICAALQQH